MMLNAVKLCNIWHLFLSKPTKFPTNFGYENTPGGEVWMKNLEAQELWGDGKRSIDSCITKKSISKYCVFFPTFSLGYNYTMRFIGYDSIQTRWFISYCFQIHTIT